MAVKKPGKNKNQPGIVLTHHPLGNPVPKHHNPSGVFLKGCQLFHFHTVDSPEFEARPKCGLISSIHRSNFSSAEISTENGTSKLPGSGRRRFSVVCYRIRHQFNTATEWFLLHSV